MLYVYFMEGYITASQATPFIYGAYGICFVGLFLLFVITLYAYKKVQKSA